MFAIRSSNVVSQRRRLALFIVGVPVALMLAGGALAGHLTSDVKSYTGCLDKGGTLSLIAEGDSPKKPCPGGSVEAHFSGGDITAVIAGDGLLGGGTNGSVTLSLDPRYALRQDCADGQVVKWDGTSTSWVCADDENTTYTAGDGLDLDGTEFSINPGYQLPQDCDLNESPTLMLDDNLILTAWGCEAHADANQDCATGKFANGVDADGDLKCATPSSGSSGGTEVWHTFTAYANAPQGFDETVATLDLPAGTYLLHAAGYGDADALDAEVFIACGFTNTTGGVSMKNNEGGLSPIPFAIQRVSTLSGNGTVSLQCGSVNGSNHVEDVDMTAIKIGTVHEQ
jgi:hypothetical protein